MSAGWSTEHVNQVLIVGAKSWLGPKELIQAIHHLRIGGLPGQSGVVKQLAERVESRILVGQPQK